MTAVAISLETLTLSTWFSGLIDSQLVVEIGEDKTTKKPVTPPDSGPYFGFGSSGALSTSAHFNVLTSVVMLTSALRWAWKRDKKKKMVVKFWFFFHLARWKQRIICSATAFVLWEFPSKVPGRELITFNCCSIPWCYVCSNQKVIMKFHIIISRV